MKRFLIIFCLLPLAVWAQDIPSVSPHATYITVEGDEIDDASSSQSAPLVAHFSANPSNVGNYQARYEWIIYKAGDTENPVLHRFEEDIDYTFSESGAFNVHLYATFVLGRDTIYYPAEGAEEPILVSVSTSQLDFPNAISPNDDGYNDELRAKDGYRSIVSFHATVYSRWGAKIYSWDDPAGKWDGKWNGKVVKDGAYLLQVTARGADGRKFNIRKTITVVSGLRGSEEGTDNE